MKLLALAVLLSASFADSATGESFRQPPSIRWDATTAQLQRELRHQCPKMTTRKVDPPFLDAVKTEQLQIDCDGFQFRGHGRHVEFVIKDGHLVMVWLMVRPEEEKAIVRDMKAALGEPSRTNANYVAFGRRRIAWRHNPAEILFYSRAVDGDVTPDFQ